MLTQEEKKFVEYWSVQRDKKKRSLRQVTVGLPLGVMIAVALLANIVTGWHKRADMALQNSGSLINNWHSSIYDNFFAKASMGSAGAALPGAFIKIKSITYAALSYKNKSYCSNAIFYDEVPLVCFIYWFVFLRMRKVRR
jgi:hypothetical protein